ncbi:hypothetical protein SAMN02910264_00372 [Ruminococcaceae bacterium YAD3003]|nr:hypothetical protein SAMN02910264_00372 [Ruminococcaceae bacterium YAD3003]
MYEYDGIFKPYKPEDEETPIYERPGRLNPDRHIPIDKSESVGVNVHYDEQQKTFVKDSDSTEFTEMSANAMNPFEDRALLKGEIKPRSTGVKTGVRKVESKIFVPETDTDEVKTKIKQTINEPQPQIYVAEEDAAASTDFIASAMSGVDTVEQQQQKSAFAVVDVSRLKMYACLLAVVIVVEIAGIALLIIL